MADADDVRRVALALPDVEEIDSDGFDFRVGGKGFVWSYPERLPGQRRVIRTDIAVLFVGDEAEKQALLLGEPEVFFTAPGYDGWPLVMLRLAQVDIERLTELVTDAWRMRAPGDLAGELDGPGPSACRYRRGELQLDAVRVFEGQHVDAERGQPRDHPMGHAVLVEQRGRLLQVLTAGHAEAEMVQAHPIRVELVPGGRHRPQPHDQVAADHDHAAEQHAEHLLRRRVAGRGRFRRHLEAEQAGIELAAALHVAHRKPQVMDVTGWNLPCHCALLPQAQYHPHTIPARVRAWTCSGPGKVRR